METLFPRNIDLYFIKDVDVKKRRVYLENFIFGKKRVYLCTPEEVLFYKNAFHEAINHNFYLSVEYDESVGIIV